MAEHRHDGHHAADAEAVHRGPRGQRAERPAPFLCRLVVATLGRGRWLHPRTLPRPWAKRGARASASEPPSPEGAGVRGCPGAGRCRDRDRPERELRRVLNWTRSALLPRARRAGPSPDGPSPLVPVRLDQVREACWGGGGWRLPWASLAAGAWRVPVQSARCLLTCPGALLGPAGSPRGWAHGGHAQPTLLLDLWGPRK